MSARNDGPIYVESDERFRLVDDDDGHWYVIPAAKLEDFRAWEYSDAAMDGWQGPSSVGSRCGWA